MHSPSFVLFRIKLDIVAWPGLIADLVLSLRFRDLLR